MLVGGRREIMCVEVILPRDPNEGKQRIAPGIGQSRSHSMWARRLGDGEYRQSERSTPLNNVPAGSLD